MSAVYKRELKNLFSNMIAPIFISVLFLFCGIYTVSGNFTSGDTRFEAVIPGVSIILMLIVPILTMQSFAAERSEKTDQALYALPLSTSSVVLGKYFAMISILGASSLAMCFIPIILSFYAKVYFVTAYVSILAFFLMGSALIAIGMFISSLTESQVIAAVISIAVFLALYLVVNLSALIPNTAGASFAITLVLALLIGVIVALMTKNLFVAAATGVILAVAATAVYLVKSTLFDKLIPNVLNKLAVFDRMTNFIYGIFDIKAIVFYLSVSSVFVFLTALAFDKKRWN